MDRLTKDNELLTPSPAEVERVARAMCDGNWDAATFNETPNGEEPEEQREYWREKARAAIAAMSRPSVPSVDAEVVEATQAVIAAMASAIDVADDIIATNIGTDTPREWNAAFRDVQRARTLLARISKEQEND